MADYSANENPAGLDILTGAQIASGDIFLFGDISDSNKVKGIIQSQFLLGLGITSNSTEINLLDGITVLSGSNTGDNATNTTYANAKTKTDFITITQPVDLDAGEILWNSALQAANISDTVYGSGWNGDITNTATKNKLYAKFELVATAISAAQSAAQSYADSLVVGLLDDRGNWDASVNTYPTSGGSGTAGAILKGDLFTMSGAGTMGTKVVTIGDVARALTDSPGQTDANWAITENNFGYVAENSANKSTDGTFAANSDTLYSSQKAIKTYTNATFQPLDSDLTTLAGLTATTDNFIVSVSSAWASRTPAQVRTTLGLVIGTNVQAFDSNLTTLTTSTQGDILYSSASNTLSKLAKSTTASRYLSNTGSSNNPAWSQIDLSNGVTGVLPYANFVNSTAASILVGRGSASGAGVFQEITLGSGLTMTNQVLSASGGGTTNPASGFHVHKNATDQAVNSATITKLTWSTELFDLGNEFASNGYTIATTGYYYVNCACRISSIGVGTTSLRLHLYKNSSLYKTFDYINIATGLTTVTMKGSCFDSFTAADVLEMFIEFNGYASGSATVDGGIANTWFSADREAAGGGDVIATAVQTLTNKTLTTPIISSTNASTAGSIGYNSTLAMHNVAGGVTGVGVVSKVIYSTNSGTETITNSAATTDIDFTSLYTFPANSIYTDKVFRITCYWLITAGASGSLTGSKYLKLGGTKIAWENQNNYAKSNTTAVTAIYYIYGIAAAGASVSVHACMDVGRIGNQLSNLAMPVTLATNGTLALTTGGQFSATGSTDTIKWIGLTVEEVY